MAEGMTPTQDFFSSAVSNTGVRLSPSLGRKKKVNTFEGSTSISFLRGRIYSLNFYTDLDHCSAIQHFIL